MSVRQIERKDWRNIVENSFETQRTLNDCIRSSNEFNLLSKENQEVLVDGVGRNLMKNYVNSWQSKNASFSQNNLAVHNTDSKLWTENYDVMSALHSKCNLFSFYESIENKVNLISFSEI